MKRTSLIVITLLLGCSSSTSPQIGLAINPNLPTHATAWESLTLLDIVTPVDIQDLVELKNENLPFLLYLGNEACGACQRFEPILTNYIQSTRIHVYYYDLLKNIYEIEALTPTFPSWFTEALATPSLYVFSSEERLLYVRGSEIFFSQSRFKNLMNQWVYPLDHSTSSST